MAVQKKVIVFGKESKTNANTIFVTEKDFQNPLVDFRSTKNTIKEIKKLEGKLFSNKSLLDLISYNEISLWHFLYMRIFDEYNKTISFIINFKKFLDETKPKKVIISKNFEWKEIIEQICKNKQIQTDCSILKFKIFKKNQKLKFALKQRGSKIITLKKIKQRTKLYNSYKKNPPDLNKKIIFAVPDVFNREIFNFERSATKNGEHLVSDIIGFINNNETIVGIDLFNFLANDQSVINNRLKSEIDWFPIEAIFSHKLDFHKHQIFLKKFNQLINSNDFKKLFLFDDIDIWNYLQQIFKKMKFYPYIPFWLILIDSLTLYFSKNKPKAIFLPYETGPQALAFIATALQHNIPTVGIQHGFIIEEDSFYSHDKFMSKEFLNGFPLPTHLLLFGDITKQILIKKGYPENRLLVFGNPTFFYLKKIINYLNSKSLLAKFNLPENKKIILFLPPAFIEHYEKGTKYNFNTKSWKYLIEKFSNNNEYFIILKPHPRDNPDVYKKILSNYNTTNIKIINDNLLELIFVSSLVISTASNTIPDSLCLKKPVIQLIFENLETNLPHGKYNTVLKSSLSELYDNLNQILTNENLRSKLLTNGENFIKKFYNIPETNPKSIIDEILS